MIKPEHELSVKRQAELLGLSRGSVYYLPRAASALDQRLMRRIDELQLEHPFAGARMLRREGFEGWAQARGHADGQDEHPGDVRQACSRSPSDRTQSAAARPG